MAGSYALPKNKVTTFRDGGKTFYIHGQSEDANTFNIRKWVEQHGDMPDGDYDVGPDKAMEGSTPFGSVQVRNGVTLKGQWVGPTGDGEITSQSVYRRPSAQQERPSGSSASNPTPEPSTKAYEEAKNAAEEYRRSTERAPQSFTPQPLFSSGGSQGGLSGFDIYNQLFARGEDLGAQYGRFIGQAQRDNRVAMEEAGLRMTEAARNLPADLRVSRGLDQETALQYVKDYRKLIT
jgi:hypothetical protein